MKKDQRADILNYITQGYSQKEACKKAGIHEGTFYRWMQNRGKLGGQNKVPRLANNREYINQLLELLK